MENKAIFLGLIYALLQAINAKEAEPALSFEDGPLSIFVDAGKEIETFLSLAQKIEKTQSLIESALERMSAEIKTLAERTTADAKATEERFTQRMTAEAKVIEERCNQRMSAEIKAIDERWNAKLSEMSRQQTQSISGKVTVLKQNVNDTRKQPPKSSAVGISHKHACEKRSHVLRSAGLSNITEMPYYANWFYTTDDRDRETCYGALIDKRFILASADCLTTHAFRSVQLSHNAERFGIKAIHMHPNYSKAATRSNFGLVELDSAVNYTRYLYPVCLYTSQSNPKNLLNRYAAVEILLLRECSEKFNVRATEICVRNLEYGCIYAGEPIYYLEEKTFPKYELFGIALNKSCGREPFVIAKVFEHLDFIESIVWPQDGN